MSQRNLAGRFVVAALVVMFLGWCGRGLLVQAPPAWAAENLTLVAEEEPMEDDAPFQQRIPAPSLDGGTEWINTAGPLDLKDLQGKFVILDFWTYCCINCMHILPELKKLEHEYPNELVVIGVHSAKFDTEQDSKNIREAVLRYEIEHPVVNDANHTIWQNYFVQSWPTLRVIDPEGYIVAGNSGEVTFEVLNDFLKKVIGHYRKRGLIDKTPLQFNLEKYRADATPLRFPGKVLADESGDRLFIADSNHNRIVVSKLDGTLLYTIGNGAIGADDGDFEKATFDHPQGMVLHGNTLYVADTENHMLRKVDLEKKQVKTIAGTGVQARTWPGMNEEGRKTSGRFAGSPRKTALNSPWDLWIHGDDLYIAMAGPHQIWKMPLDEKEIGVYAGNGREDIVDGPLLPRQPYEEGYSSFAQPSGLASDGKYLFVADSEGSSIRAVPFNRNDKVETIVGTANLPQARLFTFGDVDGQGNKVRLQHALGVVYDQGKIYVADTYNNKIKVVDPKQQSSTTIAGNGQAGLSDEPATFDEPAGISLAGSKLYVADTNNHAIRVVDLSQNNQVTTLEIAGLTAPVAPKPVKVAEPKVPVEEVKVKAARVKSQEGKIALAASLKLPPGWKINPIAPMSYRVNAEGNEGPVVREGLGTPIQVTPPSDQFEVAVPVSAATGKDQVAVQLQYFYCQEGNEGLCKMGTVRWEVPVELAADGEASVGLTYEVK
jgi:thiol-disulfide isomerase/thioredoxin